MIKVYVMATCPDCFQVKEQLKDNPNYKLIDIGEHVRNLKEFLRLRDASPAFDDARRNGYIGIPCFVTEDGGVTFSNDDVVSGDIPSGASCSINGKGC